MLFNTLLPAAAALTLFFQPALAAPINAPEHLSDGSVRFTIEGRDLQKRSVYLQDFAGCTDDQKNDLISSWQNMLEMANIVKGKVDFQEVVAIDYFGDPAKNGRVQKDIEALINNVATWTLGSVFSWHMSLRCEASLNKTPGKDCPPGTDPADTYKCNSRCFTARLNPDKSLNSWRFRALAFTRQGASTNPVAYMNFCPGWFNQSTCHDAATKWSRVETKDKWDLTNYQCREQAMTHELMHVDSHSRFATGNSEYHVYDRKFIFDVGGPDFQAYGPLYAKVLANWGEGKNPGKSVATNADSLALYFLGKWIQESYGFYPDRPRTSDVPKKILPPTGGKRQESTDVYDPIVLVNGQVKQGDPKDLAEALGLGDDTADAATELMITDPVLDCADLFGNDTVWCYNQTSDANAPIPNDANDAITLDGSIGFPTQVPEETICGATLDMANGPFGGFYQAIGQFGNNEWHTYQMNCSSYNTLVTSPPGSNPCTSLFGCDDSSGTLKFTSMNYKGTWKCAQALGTQSCGDDPIGYCCQWVALPSNQPSLEGIS